MKQRLARFMVGRNGNDQLNMFLMAVALVFCILGMIFRNVLGSISSFVVLALIVYSYFRMFSRNVYKRREENGKYLRARYAVVGWFKLQKDKWNQRRDYCFYRCPSCRNTMRVPRGRGKIRIVCRRCGTSFIRKS